jgi:hypothetical protein
LFSDIWGLRFSASTLVGALFYFIGEILMTYTKQELEGCSIYALRIIGKDLGVKKACALRKKNLIEDILAVQSGEKEPFFSKSGRPSLSNFIVSKESKPVKKEKNQNLEKERELDQILLQIKNYILKYS